MLSSRFDGLRMRGLLCFGIDSALRLTGKRWRGFLMGFGQLGPDVLPVGGAQVFAGDAATGCIFDRATSPHGYWATTTAPLRNGRRRHPEQASKFRDGRISTLANSLELFHDLMIRHCLTKKQGIAFKHKHRGALGDA